MCEDINFKTYASSTYFLKFCVNVYEINKVALFGFGCL